MTQAERSTETLETDSTDLVEVGVYETSKAGFDHGLVVLTSGYPYWLESAGDRYRLLVESTASVHVREQLAHFHRESIAWPPRLSMDPTPARRFEILTPMIWCAAALISFWAQGEWRGWTSVGLLDPQAIFERREWWRVLTALFLHADVGHLLANLVTGTFAFSAWLTTIGLWRGWLLLMVSALSGNIAAAALKFTDAYRSLGASTAIFAAIGLLAGRALRVAVQAERRRWRALFVPLSAGCIVLGLYGAGGQEVDVLAHVTGFIAGIVWGFACVARD